MPDEFAESLLEVLYLLGVFLTPPPPLNHWVSNQNPTRIGLMEHRKKRLSKSCCVTIKFLGGGASETIDEELEELVFS